LDPVLFNPTDFNADDWMKSATDLGAREICLTAHHEGGFALWPSNFTTYSVRAATAWRGGNGDVLREFADAANRWNVSICYYLNVACDHYQTTVQKYTPKQFIDAQIGMLREVLTQYGPVNRFWFDGTTGYPAGTDVQELWSRAYETIRTVSPATMISPCTFNAHNAAPARYARNCDPNDPKTQPYARPHDPKPTDRGDICAAIDTVYTNGGPAPNSTDTSACAKGGGGGGAQFFHPTEMHGITAQMGPDGNTDSLPTYWFWHPWACAGNVSGCPWVGHANASRMFDMYEFSVGHGAVLNFNAPAERTGRMNASLAAAMAEAGAALNATFRAPPLAALAGAPVSGPCAAPLIIELPGGGGQPFDYVVSMEDLTFGQRIANYSFDYQAVGSAVWEVLVPPVPANATGALGDRPDGHDPRDSHVGHKRVDRPVPATGASAGAARVKVARVRFNCLAALAEPIHVRSIELRERQVPWEAGWRGPPRAAEGK
jgi:alpha-L-fucosidase